MLGLLACSGCSGTADRQVAVVDRPHVEKVTAGFHTVQPGDTLWSIAFRFGWDWHELAARNSIPDPYVIYPGQKIRFAPAWQQPANPASRVVRSSTETTRSTAVAVSAPAATATLPAASTSKQQPSGVVAAPEPRQPVVIQPIKPAETPVSKVVKSSSGWAWPAKGTVIAKFTSNASLNKGIDIAGELGQPVIAAADGTVVYSGSGLRGYGELLIIKHNDTFVSAYGHNRRLLVSEGQEVKVGQAIAEMGSSGTDRVKLHFEIRRQGKPVDPLKYLPD